MWNVLILILAATISQAQTPATSTTPATPPPIVRAQTRLVVLDVLVTDSHGNPVKGLTLKDFQLREDGAKRDLKITEEHGIAVPGGGAASAPAQANLPVGPGLFSNRAPTGDVWNVLLLDFLDSWEEQNFAREELKRFVQGLPPDQPVALVKMGHPSKILVPFSSGVAGIQKFFANAKLSADGRPTIENLDENALSLPDVYFIDLNQPNAPVNPATGGMVSGGSAAGQRTVGGVSVSSGVGPIGSKKRQHMLLAINTFAALADWLGHYPGRKNVYWISDGFPRLEEDKDLHDWLIPRSDRLSGLFGKEQQDMDKRLQNARIAVSPIDISGVKQERRITREYLPLSDIERSGVLEDFAEQTGGVLRHNDNDIAEMLREEFNRSRDFYTLTYTPSSKNWNGQLRKISLSVKQHGYQLTYRQGYYAVDADFKPPTMDDFNQALKHGVEQVNDVVFSAHLNKDASHIVLDYSIDPASLQFATASDGRHNADMDCEVTEYDATGNLLGTARTHSLARVPQKQWSQVSQAGLPGHVVIPAEPKLAFLKVGIRDSATGRFGTLEVALAPAASSR
jgi:VWFA-related protein